MMENSYTVRNSIESVRIPLLVQSILDNYTEDIFNNVEIHESDNHDLFNIPPHQLHVVNTDSIIMASTNTELIGTPLEDAIQHKEDGLKKVLEGKAPYSVEQMEHLGVKVIDVSVPIRKNGKIIGALHYVEPYLKLEKLIKESFVRHSVFAIILIISLSVFINFFLTRMVIRPITALSNAMDRIRLGGESEEIAISSKNEIGHLEQSFNQMSHALKERQEEVEKYTLKLEKMVDERTRKLKESHEQLIQSEKLSSMGKLAAYLAHEINNPIGIIVSRAECILMDAEDEGYPEHIIKDIDVIRKHSHRIAVVTNNMLTFTRKSSVQFSPTDINKVIDDTLLFLEKRFITDQIEVRKEMDYSIPDINGNANRIQQVLLNIFNNAKDAMPDGGEIRIRSRDNGNGMINVVISDSGAGIEEENLDRIFEPFFTTKEAGKGTGLGLSVVRGIIEDHQGRITVQSEVGKGTTFEILLPVSNDDITEA